jgi:hypothetical protein
VLARDDMQIADAQSGQKLTCRIKLLWFGQVCDVAGVDCKGRPLRNALIRSIERLRVPMTSGFASLLKPMCVSLI